MNLPRLRSLLRNLFRKERVERDLDADVVAYLQQLTDEKVAAGLAPEEARREARMELGGVEQVKEEVRAVRAGASFERFVQDARVGLRSLLRAKGLTTTVVVTLALGIGANAAIFSVVRGVLLRPLVNRGEERLVYIRQSAPGIGSENITFSVPEIEDLRSRATTIGAFGDFSTIEFTMLGAGDPRLVRAGVVGGSFFEVMGLRPALGRLLSSADDGRAAAGAVVLTHRFWTSAFNADPTVIGRTIGLGPRSATIVGVLEPSVPYPAETEIIANIATSPHHLGATMNTERTHRMTELFGRLAPGASVQDARAELTVAHTVMVREHPEAYATRANVRLTVTPLRDQITAPARTILLVLLAAAGIVFLIACSNVANLILARSVRREGELAVRAALGATHGALRRALLAESLVLCGAGAVLGVLLANPFVALFARFASRFSVRALEVTVDSSVLWIGAGLAMAAAVFLAYVPRLPSSHAPTGLGVASGDGRMPAGMNRRLRAFATTQIAFSFVLLAAAGMLVAALIALQTASTSYDMRQVMAVDVPPLSVGTLEAKDVGFYQEVTRRIRELPGVEGVALGTFVPWRDIGTWPRFQFTVEGYTPADGEESPHARLRFIGPDFFSVLGIPLVAGREFTSDDRLDSEPVVIVSQSIAQRLFLDGDALNRRLSWNGPPFCKPRPCRIVGIAEDVDDENIVRSTAMTIYQPVFQKGLVSRLFVRTSGNPYTLVPTVTRIIRGLSPTQAIERPATLEDVRAKVLSPERLNAFVISGFAGIALLIAVVGVSGVLAFSVSARTREFGVRLALGAAPSRLLAGVLSEGARIVIPGIVAGAAGGYVFARIAASHLEDVRVPGLPPIFAAAAVLAVAAVFGALMPAVRAAHVDVLQALRSE